MQTKIDKIHELVRQLNKASKAYYQDSNPIMTDLEYDKLYDELVSLEKETGVTLSNSPTVKVGYELLSSLPKERHEERMLSLDKTKEEDALVAWIGDKEGLLSWKLDGLTIVLTYENGQLVKGVTRGNGEIGEVVTNNVRTFVNIPLTIPAKEKIIVRGEAVIKYSDFEKINEKLEEDQKYKNPRNLCSGSVRQLNNEETAKRRVHFYAFQLVSNREATYELKSQQLTYMQSLGFDCVETIKVTADTIVETINDFKEKITTYDVASDGLVLTYDDIAYSENLGQTSKFPRHSMAFKWQDELAKTKLVDIEWSASRTGLINPVAIFEPVELEGTTVTRASLHNLSIIEDLELGLNDEISVYKANMIIPQVAENYTKSNNLEVPNVCPVCHEETVINEANGVKTLFCQNVECPAKKVKSFAHFVSRDAMNIEGLSEATLEKFLQQEFLKNRQELFTLEQYEEDIVALEGFGRKSYDNLQASIEKSKEVELANFIYALGILNVGLSNAKLLAKYYQGDFAAIRNASVEEMIDIEGFGEVISKSIYDYFREAHNIEELDGILSYISIKALEVSDIPQSLEGKTFVITGSLEQYANRKALKKVIEDLGGKVTGSVTGKTDYLINNNVTSTSSKNKKAKELEIPIITEKDFMDLL